MKSKVTRNVQGGPEGYLRTEVIGQETIFNIKKIKIKKTRAKLMSPLRQGARLNRVLVLKRTVVTWKRDSYFEGL